MSQLTHLRKTQGLMRKFSLKVLVNVQEERLNDEGSEERQII